LIFDVNTPEVTKDISKYLGWNEPVIRDIGVNKSIYEPYSYFFGYPLFAGQSLRLTKKENTSVQTISLSEVSNYPAMTIMELDTEMQPLIEADYSNPLTDSWGRGEIRTISYFAAFEHIYVIELDPDNNQAYIVEVIIDITR
jgi:hypothetical protein